MRVISLGAVSALALALASPVVAQPSPTAGNLEKLGNFQQTGTADMAHIPQSGPKAEAGGSAWLVAGLQASTTTRAA